MGSWKGKRAGLHRVLEFPMVERKVMRVLPSGRGWCIGQDAEITTHSPRLSGAKRLGSHPAPRASCSEMTFLPIQGQPCW